MTKLMIYTKRSVYCKVRVWNLGH